VLVLPRGHGQCAVRHHEELAQPTELLLHGAAQVEHQMKRIGDLGGLRRAAAHAVGIRKHA
jgi:hypothetical protein